MLTVDVGLANSQNIRERCKSRLLSALQVSNTKGQLLFRSREGIHLEQERQLQKKGFIIHPYSMFRWYWDLLMIIVFGISLLFTPVDVCFFSNNVDDYNPFRASTLITDIFFTIDIAFNFMTGYIIGESSDKVEIGPKKMFLHYLRTWFAIDLLAVMPFDGIYMLLIEQTSYEQTLWILRFTKLPSLLRVFSIVRLLRGIYKAELYLKVDDAVTNIISLLIIIFVFLHWSCCLQYLIVFHEGFPDKSWVIQEELVRINGNSTELIADNWTIYTRSLWRTMSHMLGMGYGSAPPETLTDLWIVIFSVFLGTASYGLIIGSLSNIVATQNMSAKNYTKMIDNVLHYLRFRKIPLPLREKVMKYYGHKFHDEYFDEHRIILDPTSMSHNLRKKILLHNCRPLVARVKFFEKMSENFLFDIVQKLQFQIYLEHDIIIQAGDKGDTMHFLEYGSVKIQYANTKVDYLRDGSYFGEVALLSGEHQMITVEAQEVCRIYCLNKVDFDHVVAHYPSYMYKLRHGSQNDEQ